MPSYTGMYNELALNPSGHLACTGWVDPFTGFPDPITGTVDFGEGSTDWALFIKNLYLTDYYYKYIIYDEREDDRGLGIMVKRGVPFRMEYMWDIVLPATGGFMFNAIKGWSSMLLGTGNIDATGFVSYDSSPDLIWYSAPELAYLDNYDGNPVIYDGKYIGGAANPTGQAGMSVDLSTDADIDALAAPTVSGGYVTRVSGAQAYEIHVLGDRLFIQTTVLDAVNAPIAWDPNVAFSPDSSGEMSYPTSGALPEITLTVDEQGLPADVNTLFRDVTQKAIVYTARRMNKTMRDVYGNASGYVTDIPDATGLHHAFTILSSGMITPPSGLSWPVLGNPTPSGEQDPATNSGMYPSGTQDWEYRKTVRELDSTADFMNGAMPWTVAKFRNLQRRINHLVGTGTVMGSRLLRAIMPVMGRVDTFAELPLAPDGTQIFWVVEKEAYYYYNVMHAAWETAWAVIGGSGDCYPNAPAGTGVFSTWRGIAGLPSQVEDFTANTYRPNWKMVPGLDIYSKVCQDSFLGEVGQGYIDMSRPVNGFEMENPETQFVNAYKDFHRKMGSIRYAQLMPSGTMSGIMADNFMDQIVFGGSGNFISSVSISGMKAIIEWHKKSVGNLLAGEMDFDVSGVFSNQLYQGRENLMSPVPTGSGQFIGPHRDMYVSPTQPFFYDWIDGIKITYFDPNA
jgi:hypothetical protein